MSTEYLYLFSQSGRLMRVNTALHEIVAVSLTLLQIMRYYHYIQAQKLFQPISEIRVSEIILFGLIFDACP